MANSKQYILGLFPDNNNNEISAADMRIFVNAIFDEEIDTVDIVDNLFSTNGQMPLSANQGRILNGKITTVETDIDTKEDSLGLGSVNQVLTIDLNNNKVWKTPDSYNQVVVYDDLNSVSSSLALSANQGRILNDKTTLNISKILNNESNIASNTNDINNNNIFMSLNSTRIDTNEADISTMRSDILINANNININSNSVASNLSLINTNIAEIDANRVLIDTNGVSILALNDDIVRIDGEIGVVNGRLTINEADILALQGQIGSTDLSALQSQVNLNTANIDTNILRIDSNLTQIGLNSAAIGTNTISIGVNSSNIATNTQNITTNRNNITNNNNRINTNTDDIAAHKLITDTNTSDISINLAKTESNETSIQGNLIKINDNENITTQNTTDIYNNKLDIEILQTESIQHFTDTNANFVLTENNRENIINLNQDLGTTNLAHSALALEVAGKEEDLNAPDRDNMVLGSLIDGTRVWLDNALSEQTFDVIDNLTSAGVTDDALSANMGHELNQMVQARENYLGLPRLNGMILSSDQIGTRSWVEANVLNVDYGSFFGTGFRLITISIIDSIGGIIDNTHQDATRQLICMATYDNGVGTPTVTVDATDAVDWHSDNADAYTILDGVNGGLVFCTTQIATGSSYASIPVRASLTVGSETKESSINIEIDNTPIVATITVLPNPISIALNNSAQGLANATYTHNNWLALPEDITNSSNWVSSNPAVATVNSANGIIASVSVGQATMTVTKSPSLDNIQGTTSVSVTAL